MAIPVEIRIKKTYRALFDAFTELLEALMGKPVEEMQELYNHREIEK